MVELPGEVLLVDLLMRGIVGESRLLAPVVLDPGLTYTAAFDPGRTRPDRGRFSGNGRHFCTKAIDFRLVWFGGYPLPIVTKSLLVPYSAAQMFELVNDVESYPRFLPWCRAGRWLPSTTRELCAEIEVARAGIHQVFSTYNRNTPYERIELRLREGPFRKLLGHWTFTPLGEDACKVKLVLEFEFAGRLIDAAFGTVFNHIANSLVDAFYKRAREVYGGRD